MMAAKLIKIPYNLVNVLEGHAQLITFAMIFLAKSVTAPKIISQPQNGKKMFMTSWCTNASANHANYLSVDLLVHANCPPTADLLNYFFNKGIHDSRVLTKIQTEI